MSWLRHPGGVLLLPSLLCLDAPLVAAGWATAVWKAAEKGTTPPIAPVLALSLVVWIVYLVDRLLDSRKVDSSGEVLSFRHTFARRYRWVLVGAIVLATALLARIDIPALGRSVLLGALALGAVTIGYFLWFRVGRGRENRPSIPGKEIVIAACFAGGILVAAGSYPPLFAIGLTTLFLANCLAISAAESGIDRSRDPAAFFAAGECDPRPWIAATLAVSISCVIVRVFSGRVDWLLDAPLVLSAVATAFLWRRIPPRLAQPVLDVALLAPWPILAMQQG